MNRRLSAVIATASGGLIVGEQLAIRAVEMLAPVGVALTGSMLVIAFAASAVGALLGGRRSGRPARRLLLLGGLGAAFVAGTPLWSLFVAERFSLEPFSPTTTILLAVACAIVPLGLVLGAIFPAAVECFDGEPRERVARASVAGALGAVGGALAPELIEPLGDRSLALIGGLAIAIAVLSLAPRLPAAIALVAALAASPLLIPRLPDGCEVATRYYACLSIVRPHADEPTLIELVVGRGGLVSSFYLDTGTPVRVYIGAARSLALTRVLPGSGTIATLGGGGLGFPRLWDAESNEGVVTRQVAVEIDAQMLELINRAAPATSVEGLEIVAADARRWLASQPDHSLRLTFVDAFRTAEPAPGMLSREFAEELLRTTKGDGLVIYHTAGWGLHRIARAAAATLAETFPWVGAVRLVPPNAFTGDASDSKWLVVASRTPLEADALAAALPPDPDWQIEEYRSDEVGWSEFLGEIGALSDDFAPLEWYTLLDTIELNARRGR